MKNCILLFLAFSISGCASYNQKAVCLQIGTTNASVPYVGGATNGSGYACYLSCLGSKCPVPNNENITKLMSDEINFTNNTIITSGAVRVTATPIK